jgi:hypothetical protein
MAGNHGGVRNAPVTHLPNSFAYEQSDIPPGVSVTEWRSNRSRPNRRAQVFGGLVGAAATLGPLALMFRGIRNNGHH